jgi:hypothetical protein
MSYCPTSNLVTFPYHIYNKNILFYVYGSEGDAARGIWEFETGDIRRLENFVQ